MTQITVEYEAGEVKAEFVHSRLWLWDPEAFFYRTISQFCPHRNIAGGECVDCSLVLEDD